MTLAAKVVFLDIIMIRESVSHLAALIVLSMQEELQAQLYAMSVSLAILFCMVVAINV